MTTIDLIKLAINSKSSLEFDYENLIRFASPHILGIKGTVNNCFCYQYNGRSKTGTIPDWRCFEVSKMKNVRIIENVYKTDKSYSESKQTCVERIVCKVKL